MNMGISAVTVVNKSSNIDEIITNFNRQSFENKELIIIINDDALSIESLLRYELKEKGFRVYQLPEEISLGLCLNFAVRKAKYEYIAKWDADYYGDLYLQELWNIYMNIKCDVIYKKHTYGYLKEEHELFLSKIENEKEMRGKALSFTKEYLSNRWFKDADEGIFERIYKDSVRRYIKIGSGSRYHFISLEDFKEDGEKVSIAKNIDFEKACEIVNRIEMPDIERKHHTIIFLFELTPYKYIASRHTASWMRERLNKFKETLLSSLQQQENQDYECYISYAKGSQQIAEQCIREAKLDAPHLYWGEYIENIEQINQVISNSQYLYLVRVMEQMKIKKTFVSQLQALTVDLNQYRIIDCYVYNEAGAVSGGLYTYLYDAQNFINGERISLKNIEKELVDRLKKSIN